MLSIAARSGAPALARRTATGCRRRLASDQHPPQPPPPPPPPPKSRTERAASVTPYFGVALLGCYVAYVIQNRFAYHHERRAELDEMKAQKAAREAALAAAGPGAARQQ